MVGKGRLTVKRLKGIRERLKWSSYKMAKQLGISRMTYSHLETHGYSIRFDILVALQELLAERLGMSLQEFWEVIKVEGKAVRETRGRKTDED